MDILAFGIGNSVELTNCDVIFDVKTHRIKNSPLLVSYESLRSTADQFHLFQE